MPIYLLIKAFNIEVSPIYMTQESCKMIEKISKLGKSTGVWNFIFNVPGFEHYKLEEIR